MLKQTISKTSSLITINKPKDTPPTNSTTGETVEIHERSTPVVDVKDTAETKYRAPIGSSDSKELKN